MVGQRVVLIIFSAFLVICGSPDSRSWAQDRFVTIDMFSTNLGPVSAESQGRQLIGQSPLILSFNDAGAWYLRVMTIDMTTGSTLGRVVDFSHPPDPCVPPNPVRPLYSEHFIPGHVIVLGDDFTLVALSMSILPDGTPQAGDPVCHPPEPGTEGLGAATALMEMTGTNFPDGLARLYVGSASGMIARYVMAAGEAPVLEAIIDLLAGQPISDMELIPNAVGPLVGVATGIDIYGVLDADIGSAQRSGLISNRPRGASALLASVQFVRTNPFRLPVMDFVVYPEPLWPNGPVNLAFCNGLDQTVIRAEVQFDAAGSSTMTTSPVGTVPPVQIGPLVGLASGSLLMLTQDGQKVYYDPRFDVEWGFSGWIIDVNCPILVTGDVNQNSSLTSADIVFLVGFVFKSGAPLEPCEAAGDVNCDGSVTSADIIYLINHVFKGGAWPCDVCTLIPTVWTCL